MLPKNRFIDHLSCIYTVVKILLFIYFISFSVCLMQKSSLIMIFDG